MANDVQDAVREVLLRALNSGRGSGSGNDNGNESSKDRSGGGMKGAKGLIAGAGAAALAPLAFKGAERLAHSLGIDDVESLLHSPGEALHDITSKLGDHVGQSIGDKVTGKIDDAGGPGGIIKDALPFGGGGDDDDGGGGGGGGKNAAQGVGKGRRMPVQQSIDIGVPLESVYNQFTQFEDWPTFMHRVRRVTQEDPCTVSFATKIWGKTKEFTAKIETQRPDQRIKWKVSQGMTHTGVVTFHEVTPDLTRVLLTMDVEPGSLIEKAARGMRHVKRAARADLHRFAALIEMSGQETGAWRGTIENGDVVEDHDPSYDEDREYADLDDLVQGQGEDEEQEDEQEDEQDEDQDSEQDDEQQQDDQDEEEEKKPSRSRRSQSGSRAKQESKSGRSSNGKSGDGQSSRGQRSSGQRSNGGSSGSGGAQAQRRSSSRARGGHDQDEQGQGRARTGGRSSGGGQSGRRRSRNSHDE